MKRYISVKLIFLSSSVVPSLLHEHVIVYLYVLCWLTDDMRFFCLGQASGGYTGDYIIGSASVALTKLRHNRVMQIMSQILEDLVQGKCVIINCCSFLQLQISHMGGAGQAVLLFNLLIDGV